MLTGVNILCFIGGLLSIDKDPKVIQADGRRQVDWLGAVLITAALVMILFVLGQGESAPKQWATSCKPIHSPFHRFMTNLIGQTLLLY